MTIDKRRKDLDDDRLRAAVAFGFDLTAEKTAEFAGVSLSSVKRWKTDPEITAVTETVRACHSIARSRDLESAATDALTDNAERMKRVLDRALRQTERALTAIENEENPDFQQLLAVHQNMTMWATKFFVSEAPKRLQMEGSHTHTHVHVISLAEAANHHETKQLVSRPLIAGAANVIDVTDA